MNEIFPHIFVGDWNSSIDETLLKQNNIKAILCINEDAKPAWAHKMYSKLGIYHLPVMMADDPSVNFLHIYPTVYPFIDQYISSGQNVLIHCTAGISRSASFALAYLIIKDNGQKTLAQWLEPVRDERPIINPNPGFTKQLNYLRERVKQGQPYWNYNG